MPVHNRPHGTVILLTYCKLNDMCNAEAYCGPYGQRTKINYRRSIAQYIVFVKNLETIYSYAGGDTEKEISLF